MSVQLRPLFAQLRALFKLHETRCVVLQDTADRYALVSPKLTPGERGPSVFGEVELGPTQVSVRLAPLALHPELRQDLSPDLKRRLRRGDRLVFKSLDDSLAEDLAALIGRGLVLFEADGRL